MKFRTVELVGKTATGAHVPDEVFEGLGAGKRPAVRVTIDGGHAYRSTVASMGGRSTIGVSAENSEAAGVAGGETIDVEIAALDEGRPRSIEPARGRSSTRVP